MLRPADKASVCRQRRLVFAVCGAGVLAIDTDGFAARRGAVTAYYRDGPGISSVEQDPPEQFRVSVLVP